MFVKTENDEKVEVSGMLSVSIEPDDVSTNIWQLLVKTYGKNGQFTGKKVIAKFDTVEKANNAYLSLKFAYNQRLGWDAVEYLKEH